MENSIAVIIPARLHSTRLPKKVLADLGGKPMIHWVVQNALKADIGKVIVACSNDSIADALRSLDVECIMTDENLANGTERVYSALQNKAQNIKYVINLQGDLPFVDPNILRAIAATLKSNLYDIVTPICAIKDAADIQNPNVVKVVLADNNKAIYFSRSAIPYGTGPFYKHIGIYGYKISALQQLMSHDTTELEVREKLEQLRALNYGMSIQCELVDSFPISVDTLEDLQIAQQYYIKNIVSA